MNGEFNWEAFYRAPIIGILRNYPAAVVRELTLAAMRGGLTTLEITMNSPDAPALIRLARDVTGEALNIGAGTVCTREDLDRARKAGAEFIVTPVLVPEVIAACKDHGLPVFPGAYSPTEIYQAWTLGADMVKIFPADQLGPAYLRSIKAPLPQIRLLPTGGVTLESLPEFARAGADGFGIGSPLFAKARVEAEDWAWIEARARQFVAAYIAACAVP